MAFATLSHHSLRTTLSALVLITLIATGLEQLLLRGCGDCESSFILGHVDRASSQDQVLGNSFSWIASDSLTRNPAVAPVTLQASSARPHKTTLTVSSSSFSSCGSTADSGLVTAARLPGNSKLRLRKHQDKWNGGRISTDILHMPETSLGCQHNTDYPSPSRKD